MMVDAVMPANDHKISTGSSQQDCLSFFGTLLCGKLIEVTYV
jgi:hypothetical protein